EQSGNLSLAIQPDDFRRWHLGKAWHGHDVTADHHNEFRPRRKPDLTYGYYVVRRRTFQIGIGGERILGLGHADREFAVALRLIGPELVAHRLVSHDIIGAVDFPGNGLDLVPQGQFIAVNWFELHRASVGKFRHVLCERLGTLAAFGPVRAFEGLDAVLLAEAADDVHFRIGIRHKMIDR